MKKLSLERLYFTGLLLSCRENNINVASPNKVELYTIHIIVGRKPKP